MRCPSCGANVSGAFCEYCGAKMPVERVETQSIHGENVVVNNYYGRPPGQAGSAGGYSVPNELAASSKSRLVTVLLCVFLGYFGAHRFYVGRYLVGAVYLLTLGLLGFGWLVDVVLALLGRIRDRNGAPVSRW